MYVENKCRIDYRYKQSTLSPTEGRTVISNVVSTQIINQKLMVTKEVNKKKVFSYEILLYTIKIINISDELVGNLFFKDLIEKGSRFINNTVTLNGRGLRCVNVEEGFNIGSIKPKEEFKITFKVLVLPKEGEIKNQGDVVYDYIYNMEKPPLRVEAKSNEVVSYRNNNLFKEVIGSSLIKTLCGITEIISVRCISEVINSKIINSYIKDNDNILVVYKLTYEVCYRSEGEFKDFTQVFGFSETLLVPVGIMYEKDIDVKISILNVNYNLISCNRLFLSSAVFLYI